MYGKTFSSFIVRLKKKRSLARINGAPSLSTLKLN